MGSKAGHGFFMEADQASMTGSKTAESKDFVLFPLRLDIYQGVSLAEKTTMVGRFYAANWKLR